jgi:hypothetical protein
MISIKNNLYNKMKAISYLIAFSIFISFAAFSITVLAQDNEKAQKEYEEFDSTNFDETSINIKMNGCL